MYKDLFNIKKIIEEYIQGITDTRSTVINNTSKEIFSSIDLLNKALKNSLKLNSEIMDSIKNLPKPKREIIDHLIHSGWTLPHSLFIEIFSDEEMISFSPEEIDNVFIFMYMDNEKKLFNETKYFILDEVSYKYKSVLEVCFELFEDNNIAITIPTLLTIVEGEMSHISGLNDARGFKEKVKKNFGYQNQRLADVEQVKDISIYSLVFYLSEVLFKNIDFTDKEYTHLNRNKILHGWDNPNSWNKVDFIRLIHTILTIEMIKR